MEHQKLAEFNLENVTQHPFIKSMGSHTCLVADNNLHKKMDLYFFKSQMSDWLEDVTTLERKNRIRDFYNDRKAYKVRKTIFKNAGIELDSHKSTILDEAVGLGLELDYDAMAKSFQETIMNNDKAEIPFFTYMNFLKQICQLKLLESKLLYIFKDDIDRENKNGSISILSTIENATNAMYIIIQSPYAFYGKETIETYAKSFLKSLNEHKTFGLEQKSLIIERYSNLPMLVYENTVQNMIDDNADDVQEFCECIQSSMDNLIANNINVVKQYKSLAQKTGSEANVAIDEEEVEQPYEPATDYIDPSIR